MIKSKLKRHYIQKKTQKLSKAKNGKSVVSNKKIQSVGILTQDQFFKKYNLQELIENSLELRNSKIYSYRKFEKGQEKSYKHFSENDFDWKAEVIENSLQSFLDEPFDLLICFYPTNHSYLDYVSLLSKSTFKVGFAGVNSNLFDLEVSIEESEIEKFFREIKKYLTILNKL